MYDKIHYNIKKKEKKVKEKSFLFRLGREYTVTVDLSFVKY